MSQLSIRLHYRSAIGLAIILVLTLYVVVPQIGGLHHSWHLLSHPEWRWVIAAIGLTFLTYAAAGLTYYFLAFKPVAYRQLVLVQLAAMFVNKLLPAGIGALGANYLYLRKRKHNNIQAGSIVAANNLLGIVGHFLIVALSLILFADLAKPSQFWQKPAHLRLFLGAIALVVTTVITAVLTSRRFRQSLDRLRQQFVYFTARPGRLLAALASSISLTLCNVLALGCCGLALHVHLPFVAILLVFSVGAAAATAAPTPGGLGGYEAGLFAGFVAYRINAPTALAAALLYRLISYWLPMAVGAVAFIVAEAKNLFEH